MPRALRLEGPRVSTNGRQVSWRAVCPTASSTRSGWFLGYASEWTSQSLCFEAFLVFLPAFSTGISPVRQGKSHRPLATARFIDALLRKTYQNGYFCRNLSKKIGYFPR